MFGIIIAVSFLVTLAVITLKTLAAQHGRNARASRRNW